MPRRESVGQFDRRIQFSLKWRTCYGKAGILVLKTVVALNNTIFFLKCELFGIRALGEHHLLVICSSSSSTRYVTKCVLHCTPKNFAGGLNRQNLTAKEVKHDFEPDWHRNSFHVYQTYIEMVGPGTCVTNLFLSGNFYLSISLSDWRIFF